MMENSDLGKLEEIYKQHRPTLWAFEGGREAAVLLPLILSEEEETAVLFEVRSHKLRTQPLQVCFPGGGIEKGEDPEETAVRETAEELLIRPDQISVLSQIDGTLGPAGSPIWAYTGMIKEYQGTFSKDEVEKVFKVPLSWFLDHEPEIYTARLYTDLVDQFPIEILPGRENPGDRSYTNLIPVYRYGKYIIWGATARIVRCFARRLASADQRNSAADFYHHF